MKNSIKNDNYILISEQLANDMQISQNYGDNIIKLKTGKENYNGKELHYLYSPINTKNLTTNLLISPKFMEETPIIEFNFLQWVRRIFSQKNVYS